MDSEKKGYIFLWKIENFSCTWHRKGQGIESPIFGVDAMEMTKWRLWLFPKGDSNEAYIAYYLKRLDNSKGPDSIEINYELSFLADNGATLKPTIDLKDKFEKGQGKGKRQFLARDEVFNSKHLSNDSLTAYCRIWINGSNLGSAIFFARTIINVEKCFFPWNIKNFSRITSSQKTTYSIKSASDDDLVTLELFLTGQCCEESINICIRTYNPNVKYFKFNSFLLDSTGSRINCGLLEFRATDFLDNGKLILLVTKKKLIEKKNVYLPNDVFSLNCECDFSTKIAFEGIERIDHGIHPSKFGIATSVEKDSSDASVGITDALRSLYSEGLFCDMKLRTSTKTFPVHKNILSARSPVFKAMFTNDMKEKNTECVDITDMNADTIHRMLFYVYTDILEDLHSESASQLYVAADKYQILSLKNKCTTFLITNLNANNVCEVLILADMHQDNYLKNSVQNYILHNDKAIICSSEWKELMDSHTKLAAETMFLKYYKD
ncbi:TD and POZ domain-containing protein 3 [Nephila pilipes]|uniref:TD and POZ domain-containing protein 3 n=1 Tax=Nephila pilipes TaxID=299642 RepID=A0A8X6MS14_NEPPI|nr:TD and POZ domain-containing protein 3 [Nephila pilipes]